MSDYNPDWEEDEFINESQYIQWLHEQASERAKYEYRACPTCSREVQLCFEWNIVDEQWHCYDPTCPFCETWLIPPVDD